MKNVDHRVKYSVENEVAYVSLNRVDKYNALDYEMINSLLLLAKGIKKDRSIRAVILSAEGKHFSSGLDFASTKTNPLFIPKIFVKLPWTSMNKVQRVCLAWRSLPVPVIAVIHGKCLGGGLQVAMGADFRFATPDAELSILEAKWGLIPDMGGTVVFREQMPLDQIKLLTMTGRFIKAEQAREVGLLTKIYDKPMEEAEALCRELIQKSPDAIAVGKKLLQDSWFGSTRALLFRERFAQMRLFGRKNQKIAIAKQSKEDLAFQQRSVG